MTTDSAFSTEQHRNDSLVGTHRPNWRRGWARLTFAAGVISLGLIAGCQAPSAAMAPASGGAGPQAEVQTIREGDVIKVSFPGNPTLDTTQQVRRDGRISLAMVGEVVAAGMAPTELEKDLIQRYSSQLVSKEVSVTVVSTSFTVYVSGAVLRPGKFTSDRPITALEAIMEAGGFDPAKADARAVQVIRQEGGQTKNFTLNLKLFLEGKQGETFYLKSADIVFVPEKFTLF